MALEFNKVMAQVDKMGRMLEELDFDMADTLSLARQRFESAGDLDEVRERINWVRESNISGYRGAAPLSQDEAEPINLIVPPPDPISEATIIAADGSQIYPDEQAAVHYYLLNIGLFVYHHGTERKPEQITEPSLKYHKSHVHDRYGRVIRNRTVDDRRTVEEMHRLAKEAWQRRTEVQPVVALYDNRLLYLPTDNVGKDENLLRDYFSALVHMYDSGATLAGYVDNPHRSKRFIQLLFLTTLQSRQQLHDQQHELTECGDMEGLRDRDFFRWVLKNGERSAIMVQNSPQNYTFKERGENYEIAFFYLKVFNSYQSRVVRVDVPVWVARDPARVNALHALLLSQCKLQGRNPYPYALTRADELAYVGHRDRDKMSQLVNAQVRRVRQELVQDTLMTAKARGKELARGEKRYFEMD